MFFSSKRFPIPSHLLAGKKTVWANFGFWADAKKQDYESACSNLVDLHAMQVPISSESEVLDISSGLGGSVHFLKEKYRLRKIDATDLHPWFDVTMCRKFYQLDLQKDIRNFKYTFLFPKNSYDFVLAVDCIYHCTSLHDVKIFLDFVLKPGGSAAFSMICQTEGSVISVWEWALLRLLGISKQMIQTRSTWENEWERNSIFSKIDLQNITPQVWGGYIQFCESHKTSSKSILLSFVEKIIRHFLKKGSLEYCLVVVHRND